MNSNWLEIADEDVDAQETMRRIRERMSLWIDAAQAEELGDPVEILEATRRQAFGSSVDVSLWRERVSVWQRDCEVVPRGYVIDWRTPILGPINAWVRRIINAEIRRYLLPALEKQSYLNQVMLHALESLIQENARLYREVEQQRGTEE